MRAYLFPAYLSFLVTLCAMMTGCGSKPPAVAPEAPKVTVMQPVERQLSDHEEFNGWMAADATVNVRARVRGHITEVNFTDGQYVKKGDLLFELDPRPFQAEIGKARDSLKVFESQKTAADKEESRLKILQSKGG